MKTVLHNVIVTVYKKMKMKMATVSKFRNKRRMVTVLIKPKNGHRVQWEVRDPFSYMEEPTGWESYSAAADNPSSL